MILSGHNGCSSPLKLASSFLLNLDTLCIFVPRSCHTRKPTLTRLAIATRRRLASKNFERWDPLEVKSIWREDYFDYDNWKRRCCQWWWIGPCFNRHGEFPFPRRAFCTVCGISGYYRKRFGSQRDGKQVFRLWHSRLTKSGNSLSHGHILLSGKHSWHPPWTTATSLTSWCQKTTVQGYPRFGLLFPCTPSCGID